jgi:hypothetical protein
VCLLLVRLDSRMSHDKHFLYHPPLISCSSGTNKQNRGKKGILTESCIPTILFILLILFFVGGNFRCFYVQRPTETQEQQQQTFPPNVVALVISLKTVSEKQGTQADTEFTTQVLRAYPKGYPVFLTSDVTREYGIFLLWFFRSFPAVFPCSK